MTYRSTRRRRFEIPNQPRFLTFSCYQRLPLLREDGICKQLSRRIESLRERGAFRLHAWVLMPEHVHLLLVPELPSWPVTRILRVLKTRFAQEVLGEWRRRPEPITARLEDTRGRVHFWQRGGGHDRNIDSDLELEEKIEYVHLNPVRRGLVSVPHDWRWSSARWYEGYREGEVAVDPIRF